MSQLIGRGSIILSFAVVAASMMAVAEDTPVRVRGTLERIDGDICVIKARGGDTLQVKLADWPMVVALTKASLADIKPGSYVGVSGMPQPDGSQKALEVHIFPESMRGASRESPISASFRSRADRPSRIGGARRRAPPIF